MSFSSEQIMSIAAETAASKKAADIVVLDVKELSTVTDYFVICHGNSETQVQAIATEIKKRADELGIMVKGMEGFRAARWVLIDLGDVVVHVFHREDREYYIIERIWSDAKVVEWV